jgi:DNA-binding transcriptional LysR family regulator
MEYLMELHQLRYFCAIAEAGNFSRAAQPSLSQQIRKLEDELRARLFDRLGRTVRLTELGRAFLPRARAVLRDLEAARSEVVEHKTAVAGPVCVGVIPTIGPYFLPPVLAAFSSKYPQAHVTVSEKITRSFHECFLGDSELSWPREFGDALCECYHGRTNGGDTVSTEAVAARRHAGRHLPVIG